MRRFWIPLGILLITLIGGCDLVEDRIGDQRQSTATAPPFSTATPGGRISVWMVSPTGGVPLPGVTPQDSANLGTLVAPAATATAAAEQIIAATQTASAPTLRPAFQTANCPLPSNIPPPTQPANFTNYPEVIGTFLSNGGAPSVLESTLRSWNTINDEGGQVQADTDLTGDKVHEILVLIYNPFVYNSDAILNAGRLLIYGCDNDTYRLLYASPDNPGLALPVLHRVGDMNADVKAEVVFDTQSCTPAYCTREGQILSWNPVVGAFEPLNNGQILSTNGRLGVVDIDSDGILELTVSQVSPQTATSGPTRGAIDIWDWNTLNYVLAVRAPDDSQYRIHIVQDADNDLLTGNTQRALQLYRQARDDNRLLTWVVPNEAVLTRAYVFYRLVIGNVRAGSNERSEQAFNILISENPLGTPAAGYAAMGQAFIESIRRGESISAACQQALAVASTAPETLSFLNSFGTANRTYSFNELCPF